MEGREREWFSEFEPPAEQREPTTAPSKPSDAARSVRPPLDRIADAIEKLAADPEVEIEAGPPICPSCGACDPEIMLPEQESSSGPMSQLIINAVCRNCGEGLYIVIESYSVHRSSVTAIDEIKERERAGFFKWQDSVTTESES